MIRSVPYLVDYHALNRGQNESYKKALLIHKFKLYKSILQSSKTIPALFQLNHINKYFQIMKI